MRIRQRNRNAANPFLLRFEPVPNFVPHGHTTVPCRAHKTLQRSIAEVQAEFCIFLQILDNVTRQNVTVGHDMALYLMRISLEVDSFPPLD